MTKLVFAPGLGALGSGARPRPGAWGLGPGPQGMGPGPQGLGSGSRARGPGPGAWGLGPGARRPEPGAQNPRPKPGVQNLEVYQEVDRAIFEGERSVS